MIENKKLYIKTYGCQMNVYDSAKMVDLLKPLGFLTVESMEDADMVILNTCHIREKASEKLYSELGRIRAVKNAKQKLDEHLVICVAGCVGQAEGEEIFSRAPYVDIVVGPQSYHTLPQLLRGVAHQKKWLLNLDFPEISKFDTLSEESGSQGISAFLTIQEGCNEFCKFCVVPYTRGAEFSRPVSAIFREAVKLVEQGALEITLLGQNVNAYNGVGINNEESDLGQLIKILAKIDGLKRIRYTTSHPRSMHDSLFDAHANEEKLMPFLHLPIQSGSDRMLSAMNRKHSVEYYLNIIRRLRLYRKDIRISSDFIVGYPGETDEDFQQTLELIEEVNYASCYSFKYSPRPGTPAAQLSNQVPEEIKSERLAKLQALTNKQQEEFNRSSIGTITEVLFDREGRHANQIIGKTPYMQPVYMNDNSYFGKIAKVLLTNLSSNSLLATIYEE
ncbi:(Dimethylallyl)adenosine tRNA methylthiotransferase MiaB [Rickettsiales bacterium Ac37b]|nr:(Dimethylallyl)adenosine tRNA methylthiotransferase MiaB [Rickettsiales bacterium Ac37b]